MEPQFINKYQVTLDMLLYWARHPAGKKAIRDRKIGILLRIIIICCGFLLILCSVLTQDYTTTLLGMIAILLGLSKLFLLPRVIAKRQYDMILKSQNADIWVNQFTFSEEIICGTGNTTSRYAYADIINVTEDDQYFYLFYNEDMVLRIYKEGFLLGTVDDFRAFCKGFTQKEENTEWKK